MNRAAFLHRILERREPWDFAVVGGAGTGVGIAVDDVLARRTRVLYLNSQVAIAMAPAVARLLGAELGRDAAWQQRQLAEFDQIAGHFVANH